MHSINIAYKGSRIRLNFKLQNHQCSKVNYVHFIKKIDNTSQIRIPADNKELDKLRFEDDEKPNISQLISIFSPISFL